MNSYKVFYNKQGKNLCKTIYAWSREGAFDAVSDKGVIVYEAKLLHEHTEEDNNNTDENEIQN